MTKFLMYSAGFLRALRILSLEFLNSKPLTTTLFLGSLHCPTIFWIVEVKHGKYLAFRESVWVLIFPTIIGSLNKGSYITATVTSAVVKDITRPKRVSGSPKESAPSSSLIVVIIKYTCG